MPRAVLLSAALLCCLLPAAAQAMAAAEVQWTVEQQARIAILEGGAHQAGLGWVVDTPRYQVDCAVSAAFAARMACYLEMVEAEASSVLNLSAAPDDAVLKVQVFADRAGYQRSLGRAVRSRGQYDWSFPEGEAPRFLIRTFVLNEREQDFAHFYLPIINHELTHHLLQVRAGPKRIPHLVGEGLATWMQSWDFFRSREWNVANRVSEFSKDLARACRAGALPSLSLLAVADPWDVDNFGQATNVRYACAENFVSWCFANDAGRAFLTQLILKATTGGDILRLFADPEGNHLEMAWRQRVLDQWK